jgi:hypothetical protein
MNFLIFILLVAISFMIYHIYVTAQTQEGMDTMVEHPTKGPADPLLVIEDFLENRVLFSHSIDGIVTFLAGNNNGDKYAGLIKKLQNLQVQMNNI